MSNGLFVDFFPVLRVVLSAVYGTTTGFASNKVSFLGLVTPTLFFFLAMVLTGIEVDL
jgi:hypothetical protein